jgi:hypothetical protein
MTDILISLVAGLCAIVQEQAAALTAAGAVIAEYEAMNNETDEGLAALSVDMDAFDAELDALDAELTAAGV